MFTFFQSSLSQPFVTQRRPGRLKLFYKLETGRGHGVDLFQEGPTGSSSIAIGDPPTASLFGPDEGSVPRERAAISFCQLSPGLYHN